MTQQFLSSRRASVHTVDFWQEAEGVVSAVAFLKCQPCGSTHSVREACSSRVLFSYHRAKGVAFSGQDTPLLEPPLWQLSVALHSGSVTRNPFGMLRCWQPRRKKKVDKQHKLN